MVVGCLAVLCLGCSDSDPLDVGSVGPPRSSSSTVPLGSALPRPSGSDSSASSRVTVPAADGVAVTQGQLSAASAALGAADLDAVALGADFNRRFLSVQIRAVGFADGAAQCVTSAAETSAGARFAEMRLGQLTTMMGSIGSSLAACVSQGGVPAAIGAPDFSRVPAGEVRGVLTELLSGGFALVGVTADEAACLATRLVEVTPDAGLGALFNGGLDGQPLSSEALACLGASRIAELASR